jgi:hypothetical protein
MLAIQQNLAAASEGRFLADDPIMLGAMRYPGDNCCRLYSHINFGGSSKAFCHSGSKTKIHLNHVSGWNDVAGSWNCGKNVKYDFYNYDTNYSGWYYSIGGAGHTANSNLDSWDDYISTLVLEPYDAMVSGAITIFEHPNCQGASARLEWRDDHGMGARFNGDDMANAGLKQNMISSVAIPYGYKATMYKNDGFNGEHKTFEGRYSSSYVSAEMACQNTKNDIYSSVIVEKDSEAMATGTWEAITTTETQQYELYIGMTRGQQHGSSTETSNTISMAMELGVEFEGLFSEKESISISAS